MNVSEFNDLVLNVEHFNNTSSIHFVYLTMDHMVLGKT